MNRLERSLVLLRALNHATRHGVNCGCRESTPVFAAVHRARLEQHDADARRRADPRQLSIFDAMSTGPPAQ